MSDFFFNIDLKRQDIHSLFKPQEASLFLMDVVSQIQSFQKVETSGNVLIRIDDKIRRIFFYEENRFFSLHFPFVIQKESSFDSHRNYFSGNYAFYYKDKKLTSQVISDVIRILTNDIEKKFDESPIEDFACSVDELFYEDDCGIDSNRVDFAWRIYMYLKPFEMGYLRYDHDVDHVAPNHPLNHLDINLSKECTYKIGLPDKPRPSENWFTEMCLSNPVKCINVL